MAPWEELRYFALPSERLVVSASGGAVLIGADPMRVVLILSNTAASGALVSTSPTPVSGQGISLTTAFPVLMLTARDNPGLCQAAWFAGAGASISITVLSVSMIRWPQDASGSMPLPNQRLSDAAIRAMMGGLDARE